jgi:ribonucleoside-diphosphate reductase alpha chain
MPCETSSQITNSTNGIEPPRALVSIKGSKEGNFSQLVPEYLKLNQSYETLWEVDARDYLRTVASMQKVVDQAISSNTSYNPAKGELTMSKLLGDLLFAYKAGVKTLYYSQVNDQTGDDVTEDDGCAGGACKI